MISRINSHRTTKEEKVAAKIAKELSDFTLDLDKVGQHLANATPYVIFRRALEVLEAAEHQKESVDYRRIAHTQDPLF